MLRGLASLGAFVFACGDSASSGGDAAVHDAAVVPLAITTTGALEVDEDAELVVTVATTREARVFATALPPGARWDEATHTLRFTPDFIQGGHTWQVTLTAIAGDERVEQTLDVVARDTIAPPAPVVTTTTAAGTFSRLALTQTTDSFLDSPASAGRTFAANVTLPAAVIAGTAPAAAYPVRVILHGFGGGPGTGGSANEIRIYPHDPDNTYWWGYATALPPVAGGQVPDYTVRRVMNLLGWVLATYPAADATRVVLDGGSMGAAGAMTIGLLHARHVAHVDAVWGQAIPANHRPSRINQLRTLWGTPALDLDDGHGMGAWTRMDLTRSLRDEPEARDQFLSIKHGKDDGTIHFGAVTIASPLTQQSFYTSLQANHVGHHAIWDEGAHGPLDPLLGANWWTTWDPISDATAYLRSDRAFPAFSGASIDRDPGTGGGNGRRAFNAESGYAGSVTVVDDTGWDGERAGGINRFLRWDTTQLVDTIDRFALPLRVIDGEGAAPTREGDPTTGDKLDGEPPVTVSVTPRRVQAFQLRAGEQVAWTFGGQSGTATADATGAVTIPDLALGTEWATLEVVRAP